MCKGSNYEHFHQNSEPIQTPKATFDRRPNGQVKQIGQQECSQLLQQGLIESTDSDWACQAFYVEKQSELVREKKRLVIDYQPLNSFLKDDKFSLPKIQTLFVHLQGARIFFDTSI